MSQVIAHHRQASHNYHLETKYLAGLVLQGWEVKSLREGRAQLRDSYVVIRRGEAWLVNAHISPLPQACTHFTPDPVRSRKCLLNKKEIRQLIGAVERQGYTLVPVQLRWQRGHVKLEFALAKGKKNYDKRASEKQREWERTQQRLRTQL